MSLKKRAPAVRKYEKLCFAEHRCCVRTLQYFASIEQSENSALYRTALGRFSSPNSKKIDGTFSYLCISGAAPFF
jgi:hypothetical protein